MALTHGMDVQRVRTIAPKLVAVAGKCGDVASDGTAAVEALGQVWQGSDREAFAVRWGQAVKSLQAAQEGLSRFAEVLQRNAEAQDQTSQGGSGGPGGGAGRGNGSGNGSGSGGGSGSQLDPKEQIWGKWEHKRKPNHQIKEEGHRYRDGRYGKWSETHKDSEAWKQARKAGSALETAPIWSQLGEQKDDARVFDLAHGGDDKNGYQVEALSARYAAKGEYGISGDKGVFAQGEFVAGAYAARAAGQFQTADGWAGKGQAYVGAEGKVDGAANIGPGGANVRYGMEGFAGGKVEGEVQKDFGAATVGAGGSLSYGVGAHMKVDGGFGWDRMGGSIDVGATLGLGFSVKVQAEIDPVDTMNSIGSAFGNDDLGEDVRRGAEAVGDFLNPFD